MPRMRILSGPEQEAFDKPPLLDHRERKQVFDLPQGLVDIAASMRTPDTQIGFVLVSGCFRAARRFYSPQDFHGFAPFDQSAEASLSVEIATMARTHLKPRLIFDRCVDFLIQRRIQVPTARRFTDMIRSGLQTRKAELVALMAAHITNDARGLLDELFTAPEEQNRYRLTLLKKLSQ